MNWLRELSLVLIIGCLAVYAAETEMKNEKTDKPEVSENTSDNTPRIMDENDVRLLLKPFFVQQTTPRPERPQTIIVRPPYPHYHQHHDYHGYHDDDDYYHHYRPSYHRPSYHHPPRPHPPVYPPPHHPPVYPYYPHSSYGGYGYGYGYGNPYGYSRPRPRPVIVVIRPPGSRPEDDDITTEETEDNRFRYLYRSPMYPYPEDQVEPEVVEGEYNEEMGRNIKVDGLAIKSDVDDDTEAIAVDTKDIKLPFGLHLSSHPRYGKKVNDQEALIYLRNYKNGRKLKVAGAAGN